MPFLSKAQQRFMFSQHPDIAKRWAKKTPDFKNLPEHIKKKVLKRTLKKHTGKGGLEVSSYQQAEAPINLLRFKGSPPIAKKLANTKNNYLGTKLTK
jgi:hypothetical protein